MVISEDPACMFPIHLYSFICAYYQYTHSLTKRSSHTLADIYIYPPDSLMQFPNNHVNFYMNTKTLLYIPYLFSLIPFHMFSYFPLYFLTCSHLCWFTQCPAKGLLQIHLLNPLLLMYTHH